MVRSVRIWLVYKKEKYWIPQFKLKLCDKDIVAKGAWLTDDIINVGLKLLKEAYPHIEGLQETALGETLSYFVSRGIFVQILNVSRNHWITATSLGK